MNNLAQNEEEKLDIQDTINEAYKDLSANIKKDIEHVIDVTQRQNPNANVEPYYRDIQAEAHREAERLRAEGYAESSDEIQEQQKIWWEAQESILDLYTKAHEKIIRDIEHNRDIALEHNPYHDTTSYYKQMQDEYHRQAELLRALDPEKYKEEIQKLQMAWWEAQDAIVDWDWENSNRWIEERNANGDWALYGDSEYEAWQRVAKWLKEKYPNEIDKIHEAEQNAIDARYQHSQDWISDRNAYSDWALFGDSEIEAWERVLEYLKDYPDEINKVKEAERSLFEARKKEFNKATDFGNTYLESKKTLLQSHFDVTNSIAEARHEINKELETSKTMYEYLDAKTRQLLFNQEDYNELSSKLNQIEKDGLKLQKEYEKKLEGSTLETIESITSEYQMQYETLMKSYEIAKADLEVAKKKQKLNNVLNERNVRMFINGSWQWVANTEDVMNAKSELADAEYAKQVEEAGLTQKQSIDNLTRQQNELGIVVEKFGNGVVSLGQSIYLAEQAIGSMPSALATMFNNAKSSTKSHSGSNVTIASGGITYSHSQIASMSAAERSAAWHGASEESKYYLHEANKGDLSATHDYDSATGIWKKKEYATGTRYTAGGLALMGEDGDELYITSNGRLIPINQPTIGNISKGGVVFNAEQMKNLRTMWDMSNLNLRGGSFATKPQSQQTVQTYDNRVIINGMTVDNGSSDGQALISALRRYVGNH